MYLEAAPGISFRVGWAHPTPILTPILKNFLHALENFQGGLSSPQPTPGAATTHLAQFWKESVKKITVCSRKTLSPGQLDSFCVLVIVADQSVKALNIFLKTFCKNTSHLSYQSSFSSVVPTVSPVSIVEPNRTQTWWNRTSKSRFNSLSGEYNIRCSALCTFLCI